jgi:hypothetical protein
MGLKFIFMITKSADLKVAALYAKACHCMAKAQHYQELYI